MGICCSKPKQLDKFYSTQDAEVSEGELSKIGLGESKMARMAPAIVAPSARHTATVRILCYPVCLSYVISGIYIA